MIPRTIHRIWLGGPIPTEFENYGETWRLVNEGWEVRLWTEADLPPLRNQALYDRAPEIVESRLVPRFRSNLARYEILERFGGVYVDCDFVALRPIEPHIAGFACFAAEEKPGLVANGLMGAIPGHPLISRLIDEAERSVAERPGLPSWRTTGPEHLTRIAESMPGALDLIPTRLVYPYHHTQLSRTGRPPAIPDDAIAHHVWASRRGSISVIVPYRGGDPDRDRSWRFLRERLLRDHPDWQIVETDSTGETFSKAEAIRAGVERSFGDILIIIDSDTWIPRLDEAIERVRRVAPWAIPHRLVHRLTPEATDRFYAGDPTETLLDQTVERPYKGVVGGGCVVIRRSAFEACPPDPRFRGWGGEDEAWGLALNTIVGGAWRGDEPLLHLWHTPAPRRSRSVGSEDNMALLHRYRQSARRRPQMSDLVGEVAVIRSRHDP